MVRNYKILVLFAFFLICSKVQESKSENYTKTWSPISNSNSANYGTSMESFSVSASDNKFIYARCSLNNRFSCNIIVVPSIKEDSLEGSSCDLHLSIDDNTFRRTVGLQRFNNNKVLVTWAEQKIDYLVYNQGQNSGYEIPITALDMSSCKISRYIKYKVFANDENTMIIHPLILNDTIDMFVGDKTVCQPFERCKISFDHNNSPIGSPELFPIFLKQGYPHEVGPVGNTSVFIRGYSDPSKIRVLYTAKNYSETIELMAEYVSEGGLNTFVNSKVSNAHDLYTLCWEDRTYGKLSARCVQFDYLGRTRFNITVPFGESVEKVIGVYNLANGDILLFTQKDSEEEVRKIDADGQMGRPLGLDFSCRQKPSVVEMYVVENNDDLDIYLACAYNSGLKMSSRSVQKKYLNQHSSG